MSIKVLHESKNLLLQSEFEETFLTDKNNGNEVFRFSVYGDATCGLIAASEDWAIICGNTLWIWTKDELTEIKELCWIYDIRQISEYEVEILTDPWRQDSAIWKYDITKANFFKVLDFTDYLETAYTESVIW